MEGKLCLYVFHGQQTYMPFQRNEWICLSELINQFYTFDDLDVNFIYHILLFCYKKRLSLKKVCYCSSESKHQAKCSCTCQAVLHQLSKCDVKSFNLDYSSSNSQTDNIVWSIFFLFCVCCNYAQIWKNCMDFWNYWCHG